MKKMKKAFVLLAIIGLVGCSGQNIQKDIQDRVDNRPNVCADLDAGESTLCDAANRYKVNLNDLELVVRNAPAGAIMAKYKPGPERDKVIDKALAAVADTDAFLDGNVTGSNLFSYIKLKSDDDKLYALFVYEAVSQLLNSPDMYSVPLTEWDKKEIRKVLTEIKFRLLILRGGA